MRIIRGLYLMSINHEGDNMLRQNNHGYFNRAPNFEHDHYNHNGPRDYDDGVRFSVLRN